MLIHLHKRAQLRKVFQCKDNVTVTNKLETLYLNNNGVTFADEHLKLIAAQCNNLQDLILDYNIPLSKDPDQTVYKITDVGNVEVV